MSTDRTTIHLTNFASRLPPHRGPGRTYSIMAKPRRWEHGEGSVWRLTPRPTDLDAVRSGAIDIAEYRRRFERAGTVVVNRVTRSFYLTRRGREALNAMDDCQTARSDT